ncbi:MAG: transglutaminase family protein [Rhodobacteraceae bacterium]|nr:transglutaminase family protein [Paracoccaceae bacterium]
MRLSIIHVTTYSYDQPVHYALQQLRLVPRSGHGQTVLSWRSTITGGAKQVEFEDQFVNLTELIKLDPGTTRIEIRSEGVVEVEDTHGVIGTHKGFAPLWLFEAATPMTTPGPAIRALVRQMKAEHGEGDTLAQLHGLSTMILSQVGYLSGRTDSATPAEAALVAGHGVCQDHAHIMITAARLMGHPARYVSGYLMMDDRVDQDASHAWCEVWTEALGWVGFDVSNGICPDARYVRVATGRDYRDAAPVKGIRRGSGSEKLHVSLQVQQ